MLPALPPLDRAISLQFSGHLRRSCNFSPALAHLRACRRRFGRCEAFAHTWTELEPRTPHWRRGWPGSPLVNLSSAACVERLRESLAPTSLRVEEQPLLPANETLGPDGKPFVCRECCGERDSLAARRCRKNAEDAERLHWGPARHWGWRQNVHGMRRAAAARAEAERRQPAAPFTLSVRLRPDDVWRFGKPAQVDALWDCLQLMLAVPLQQPPADVRGGRARRPVGMVSVGEAWRQLDGVVSGCFDRTIEIDTADNCLLGRPASLDRLLALFGDEGSYRRVYDTAGRQGVVRHIPELQLFVAARLARLSSTMLCHPDAIAAGLARSVNATPAGAAETAELRARLGQEQARHAAAATAKQQAAEERRVYQARKRELRRASGRSNRVRRT